MQNISRNNKQFCENLISLIQCARIAHRQNALHLALESIIDGIFSKICLICQRGLRRGALLRCGAYL